MSRTAVRLGDICGFVRGPFGGSLRKEIFKEDGYAVFEQQHAINNQFSQIRYFIDQAKFHEMKRFELLPGELIMSCSGTMGKVAVAPQGIRRGIINQALLKISPKSSIDVDFLMYWMESKDFQRQLEAVTSGAAIKNVASVSVLKELKISLPSLEDQKRIAAILDQADELRSKRQRAIERFNQVGQAIFYEMFGDPVAPDANEAERLADIAELINGDRSSNYPSGDEIKDSGVLFLNTTNIKNGELDLSKSQFITEKKFASLSRGKLTRHDLVITLRGTLGQCALFDCEFETGFINAQMMIIRCNESIMPRYLKEYISFPSVQKKLNNANTGSAVPQLTGTQMKEMQIIVPSLSEQKEFVAAVDAARTVLGTNSSHCAGLDNLFASLQHRAFQGEL